MPEICDALVRWEIVQAGKAWSSLSLAGSKFGPDHHTEQLVEDLCYLRSWMTWDNTLQVSHKPQRSEAFLTKVWLLDD
eukprot:2769125-Amphidinium_carterae.1